jgi:hypothetical protein
LRWQQVVRTWKVRDRAGAGFLKGALWRVLKLNGVVNGVLAEGLW